MHQHLPAVIGLKTRGFIPFLAQTHVTPFNQKPDRENGIILRVFNLLESLAIWQFLQFLQFLQFCNFAISAIFEVLSSGTVSAIPGGAAIFSMAREKKGSPLLTELTFY